MRPSQVVNIKDQRTILNYGNGDHVAGGQTGPGQSCLCHKVHGYLALKLSETFVIVISERSGL